MPADTHIPVTAEIREELRALKQLVQTEAWRTEGRFLQQLLTRSVPRRVAQLVRRPKWIGLTQLVSFGVLTLSVGLGYLYGVLRW